MFTFGFASSDTSAAGPSGNANDPEFDDEFEDEESIAEGINDTLVAMMPWGISILFHLALVVLAVFLAWQVIQVKAEEEVIIPDASLTDTPGAPNPIENVQEEQSSDAPQTTPTVDPNNNPPSPAVTNTQIRTQLAGVTSFGGMTGGTFGNTDGNGEFGTSVFGNGGNARNIAFIVDASGSMMDVLPFVVDELKRVINGLREQQKFTIILFTGEGVYEVPGGGRRTGLRAATAEFKRDASEWITLENHNVEPRGRGSVNAVQAIETALKYKPQLVFLLSDNLTGGGQGATQYEIYQDELMDALREANDFSPPAKFNTLQFLYTDPLVESGTGRTGTLQLIADETQGVCRFIDEQYLNLR